MSLSQTNRLGQVQTTKLTPDQILTQKMLEMNVEELDARIKSELEVNPALEEGPEPQDEPIDGENYENEDNIGDDEEVNGRDLDESNRLNEGFSNNSDDDDDYDNYRTHTNNSSPDDKYTEIPIHVGETFVENILSQFGMLNITPTQRKIGEYIIRSLDDKGFLPIKVEQITDTLAFNENIATTDEEVEAVLEQIKELDPIGVGCHNSIEYFMLQLASKKPTPYTRLCIRILKNSTIREMYIGHNFDSLSARLEISHDDLLKIDEEMKSLNPAPNTWGGDLVANREEEITPDFHLEEHDGELILIAADSRRPEIRISKEWEENMKLYQQMGEKEGAKFCRSCIDQGKGFIEALRQRTETMNKVMYAIINYQKQYFIDGDESVLRPMVLQDIADMTGYDVSTISRVTKLKYLSTNFGTFPLRHFFSESMTTADGEEVSTRQIRQFLRDIIDGEDKINPLNDDQLVDVMNTRGYPIARRTVAKYRQQMGIPVARLRRQL